MTRDELGVPTNGSPADAEASASPQHDGRVVLSHAEIARALRRISHEILEANKGADDLVLLGVPTRGAHLVKRLAAAIGDVEGVTIPTGTLDVTMYRDDLRRHPARVAHHSDIPATGIDGKTIVLVDDVLYSGRTVRAALDALGDLGRPKAVRLAVLVDRGHRELPIRADHVGKNLPTAKGEHVRVSLTESDGVDEVRISGPAAPTSDPSLTTTEGGQA